jgi:hypothetical protein
MLLVSVVVQPSQRSKASCQPSKKRREHPPISTLSLYNETLPYRTPTGTFTNKQTNKQT